MSKDPTWQRPEWTYKMPLQTFRNLLGPVIVVRHKWTSTSEDTTANWVEFELSDGNKVKDPRQLNDLFQYKPDHRGLFRLTYEGELAEALSVKISEWDAKHVKERKEYERLKEQFGA